MPGSTRAEGSDRLPTEESIVPRSGHDGPARGAGTSFRADLDGLRAIAILLVVAYHSDIPGFGGGFIGVDVFFVISGFLITRNLVREIDDTNRVALIAFWGRRLRRLVPALALMLVVVLLLVAAVQGPLEWEAAAAQAKAAALYVSNYYFAAQPSGYFGVDLSSSIFLHTWSLGVEEQFYLVWPVLFLVAGATCRRIGLRLRHALVATLLVVLAASLLTSVLLTANGSRAAFFGLASRSWEFAAAGILAMITLPSGLRRPVTQVVMGASGLALVLLAAVWLSSADPYPGVRALIPVTGTLLVIAAGADRAPGGANALSRILGIAPLRWLGRLSYSWYLWHWPLIILTVDLIGRDSTEVRVTGALAALGVAIAAHHTIENPIRFNRRIVTSARATYVGAAVLTTIVLGVSAVLAVTAQRSIDADVVLRVVDEARTDRADQVPCTFEGRTAGNLRYCIDGDQNAEQTVVLVGDSHAEHWRLAFSDAAESRGMRLVSITKPACPSVPVRIAPFEGLGIEEGECTAFQDDAARFIDELDPALVVISNSMNYGVLVQSPDGSPPPQPDGRRLVWRDAYASLIESLRSNDMKVASVVDSPASYATDPLECLSEENPKGDCRIARAEALVGSDLRAAQADVEGRLGVPTISVVDDLCDAETCGFIVDDTVPALSDRNHLTSTFTRRYVAAIALLIDQALNDGT